MEQFIYEETNGLWYERRGDYYFPCLTAEEASSVGVWGQRHLRYIKQNRRVLYLELKTSGRLHAYLAAVARQADGMRDRLSTHRREREGVAEALKGADQMRWVQRMNSIRNRATEIVNRNLIYTYV